MSLGVAGLVAFLIVFGISLLVTFPGTNVAVAVFAFLAALFLIIANRTNTPS